MYFVLFIWIEEARYLAICRLYWFRVRFSYKRLGYFVWRRVFSPMFRNTAICCMLYGLWKNNQTEWPCMATRRRVSRGRDSGGRMWRNILCLCLNLRNMQVHSATCSFIIELYDKKRVVLHFRGFFSPYCIFIYCISLISLESKV